MVFRRYGIYNPQKETERRLWCVTNYMEIPGLVTLSEDVVAELYLIPTLPREKEDCDRTDYRHCFLSRLDAALLTTGSPIPGFGRNLWTPSLRNVTQITQQ